MVPKTNWTIQDYFKHAGVGFDGTRLRNTPAVAQPASEADFARILAGSQANAQAPTHGSNNGRRIADYLKTPVVARLPRPNAPTPPSPPSVPQTSAQSRVHTPAPRDPMDSQAAEPTPVEAARLAEAASIAPPQLPESEPTETVAEQIDRSIEKAA
ncbi:MAG: hypothetical protein WAU91_18855, partial [Desulfatitalea sp.]